MRRALLLPIWAAATACAYQAPVLDAASPANVLTGEAVTDLVAEPATTLIFATPADDPPPPWGTGSPATFTAVDASAFSDAGGLRSAPWALSELADGDWLLTGLVDVDGDFQPLVPGGAFAGATCGDVIGAWVTDLASGVPAAVHVEGGERVDGLSLLLARRLATERPAFTVRSGAVSRADAGAGQPQTMSLTSTAVHASLPAVDGELRLDLDGPFDPSAPEACATAFLAVAVDADADGEPDPHPDFPGAGLYDVWPRVYLEWIPDDYDDDGVLDAAPGEGWVGQAVPHPALVASGELPLNTPVLLSELELLWVPAGAHVTADGAREPVTFPGALPAGEWAITVVLSTGQTWTVPNGLAAATPTETGFNPATQAAGLFVH